MDITARIEGAVVGKCTAVEERARPVVEFPGNPGPPLTARTTVPLTGEAVGRPVVLVFEEGDPARPVVVGLLQEGRRRSAVRVEADGESLRLTAGKSITLVCGKSSVTLTKAGKLILRGTYVSSRSSGVNRIKGGSVEIN